MTSTTFTTTAFPVTAMDSTSSSSGDRDRAPRIPSPSPSRQSSYETTFHHPCTGTPSQSPFLRFCLMRYALAILYALSAFAVSVFYSFSKFSPPSYAEREGDEPRSRPRPGTRSRVSSPTPSIEEKEKKGHARRPSLVELGSSVLQWGRPSTTRRRSRAQVVYHELEKVQELDDEETEMESMVHDSEDSDGPSEVDTVEDTEVLLPMMSAVSGKKGFFGRRKTSSRSVSSDKSSDKSAISSTKSKGGKLCPHKAFKRSRSSSPAPTPPTLSPPLPSPSSTSSASSRKYFRFTKSRSGSPELDYTGGTSLKIADF